MRIKVLIVIVAIGICATVGSWIGRNGRKASLSNYLSQELPISMVVEDAKSSEFQKDPELFWQLRHSLHDLDPFITTKFQMSDDADKQFVQQSLTKVFPNKFVSNMNDTVYGRDTREFDVFVLTKQHGTNSFVMVLMK